MKISIIVPTYKRPKYLEQALQSAAAQDYPSDEYEVIVINDGGSGSRKIVRGLWKGQCAFQYHRIEHQGLSAAINRGLLAARGEYFTVLPDDDLICPNKLRVLGEYLDLHPQVKVVYSLPKYIDQENNPVDAPLQLSNYLKNHPVIRWDHILAGDGLWVHGTSTMYRKAVTKEVGVWDTALNTGEEYEWHLRLLKNGCDFHAVDEVTTVYRKHPGSKSKQFSKKRAEMRAYIQKKLFT